MDVKRTIRVFASCPSEVKEEIVCLRQVIDDLNAELREREVAVELLHWQTHAVPGAGRPQEVIHRSIGEYEIYLGMMWKTFGSPSGAAGSGTEEEFNEAYARFFELGVPSILFYFSQQPYVIANEHELKQLSRVFAFRRRIEKIVLFRTYASLEEFTALAHKHLQHTIVDILDKPPLDRTDVQFLSRNANDFRYPRAVREAARAWIDPRHAADTHLRSYRTSIAWFALGVLLTIVVSRYPQQSKGVDELQSLRSSLGREQVQLERWRDDLHDATSKHDVRRSEELRISIARLTARIDEDQRKIATLQR
jgi:hypothetical protein